MKRFIISSVLMFFLSSLNAQFHFSFSHFTSDNGLSQNSITAMMKDKKGYLWFGTRDGLNKFDGYQFSTINSNSNPDLSVVSNRVLSINEDNYGCIWVRTYDEIVYRLDPATDEIIRVKNPNGGFVDDKIVEISILPSGIIWLTTTNKGCYKISTNTATKDISVKYYSTGTKNLPSNQVNKIFEDKDLNTWLLTNAGLMCIDKNAKTTIYFTNQPFYSFVENDKRIIFGSLSKIYLLEVRNKTFKVVDLKENMIINNVAHISSNEYILATNNNGFFKYDVLRGSLQHFSKENYPVMKTNVIMDIYIDRAGDAWLGTSSAGVLHFNTQANTLESVESRVNEGQIGNPNFLIFEDEKDILWIQPYFGSFSWYDRVNNRLVPFYSVYNVEINTLFSYGVNHVLADSQGVMWISTNRGNGLFKCTFLPDYFNHYLIQNQSVYSISNETRAIFEDNKQRLWVGTKDGAVHVYDANKNLLGALNADGRVLKGGKAEILVYNFFQDKIGDIWLATKRQGIFRLKEKSKLVFSLENFVHKNNNPYSPINNDFYSITQDKSGRIWAGSYGGGLHLIEEKQGNIRFIHSQNELNNYPLSNCSKVRQVFADSKDQIWVATTEGVVRFDAKIDDYKKVKFSYFHKSENLPNSLGANDVHCIFEDADRELWFGTFGGGLNKLVEDTRKSTNLKFEIFDRKKGMPNNVVYTIIDDHQGNLWLTTENSIVKFYKKANTFEVFGKGNELVNVEFSEASACLLKSGEICVGAKSGFYSFLPETVRRRVIAAPLVFTGLLLFNKEVEVGAENSLLSEHIDVSKKLKFSSKQNVFTIEFATLDMRAPDKIQYAYMMEGFEEDWNYVQNIHFATYTSLSAGTYVFKVKSTDSEGVWLENERSIEVEIMPSFWQSGFAKFIYVLLILFVFSIALFIALTIYKLKNNVNVEKQMTDMKLRFFTDISHELRTPLTLISLPVDNVMKEKLDPAVMEQLQMVRRNLDRVMGLINQILDFRKVQNNKMRLSIEELKFGEYVRVSSSNFFELAHTKDIELDIIDESDGLMVWADPERLDSIIYNLLSNALKFTPVGKRIIIKTSKKNNLAVLSVIDEGVGIAQEKINFIFDRFFSIPTIKNITQKSTGIGLDLVKKLVELHHANIHVESQLGKGTQFDVEFRLGIAHYDNDVDIIISDQTMPVTAPQEPRNADVTLQTDDSVTPLILVVEDNDELRHFLKNSLKNNYRVEEAEDGSIGWQKVEHLMPDFVITDLRMPVMDGMELTQKIKNDPRTSHIPVILLTAVTDVDSKVSGMKAGADDYITKPFSSEFLHARIENLITQRQKLQLFYRTQITYSKGDLHLPPLEIESQEEVFMQTLIKLMNDNLDNFDLNIDFLATELGMSRTVFFNKLKSLTGFSPVEFVREVRFERAAEFIRNSQFTVSEISYRVGIEDPRYFSRCFKQKFGVTPSEYRQQKS